MVTFCKSVTDPYGISIFELFKYTKRDKPTYQIILQNTTWQTVSSSSLLIGARNTYHIEPVIFSHGVSRNIIETEYIYIYICVFILKQ